MIQANLVHTVGDVIISVVHNEEILKSCLAFSQGSDFLNQGERLCQKYNTLEQQYSEGNSRARESSRKLKEARKHLKLRYMRHLSIARLTFKNIPEHWEKLGLNSERYPDLQSWVKQAQRFYYHARPIGKQNESYGIPRHELEEVHQLLGQMIELSYQRKQAMTYTQLISQQKQECYAELEQWMQKFTSIACLALANKPQLLESLGIATKNKVM